MDRIRRWCVQPQHRSLGKVGSGFRAERKICVEGIEIDLEKSEKTPYKSASSDSIWRAAFQACKGAWGVLMAEHDARSALADGDTPKNYVLFPMIVTTAPLAICPLASQSVDLSSGTLREDIVLNEVPWLVLNHPFTPADGPGVRDLIKSVVGYSAPETRGLLAKEGVVVITASKLQEFFKILLGSRWANA